MGSTVSATELTVYHSKGSDGVLDVKWLKGSFFISFVGLDQFGEANQNDDSYRWV